MGKIVQNEISYSGSSAKNYADVVGTLVAGATTITLSHSSIKTDSTINFYTSKYTVNPLNVEIYTGRVVLTFRAQSVDIQVKVRVWDATGSVGPVTPDGNNIYYPVANPLNENKAYNEISVQNIALAIDEGYIKIADMADLVRKYRNAGLESTNVVIGSAEYTASELPVEE